MLLSKSEILGAEDLKHEDVHVPQWGGSVRIRMMTGAERDEFRSSVSDEGCVAVGTFAAALLAATCIDEAGIRLFTMGDMAALQAKSATSLDGPAAVAIRLNGLSVTAVEDAEKNLSSTQSDDSGSGSPDTSGKP
jgi:hypothetical protein